MTALITVKKNAFQETNLIQVSKITLLLQKKHENIIRFQKYWENDRAIQPEIEADSD